MKKLHNNIATYIFISMLFVASFVVNGNGKGTGGTWFTNLQWGVVNTNATVNDYAAANQGQLKWIATRAYSAMSNNYNIANDVPTGGFPSAAQLVAAFSNDNNYASINVGQVKYVAAPFYNWLINEGITNTYPWAGAAETNNYGAVNIGQVKQVFNFQL